MVYDNPDADRQKSQQLSFPFMQLYMNHIDDGRRFSDCGGDEKQRTSTRYIYAYNIFAAVQIRGMTIPPLFVQLISSRPQRLLAPTQRRRLRVQPLAQIPLLAIVVDERGVGHRGRDDPESGLHDEDAAEAGRAAETGPLGGTRAVDHSATYPAAEDRRLLYTAGEATGVAVE